MKPCLYLFFSFFLFGEKLLSQEIVIVDSIHGTFSPEIELRTIDISICQPSFPEKENTLNQVFDIFSIKDGTVFGHGISQGFLDTISFENNLPGIGILILNNYITVDKEKRGWTCDENDFSYSAGRGITKQVTDIWGQLNEEYIGNLPSSMQCNGGMTYRRGKFYLHSINNQLVEVNMKDPSKSKVVMDIPLGTLPIDGLATVQLGCDSVITYAIGRTPGISKVYEIDFSNWTLTELCEVPLSITGAGSHTECMLPPCDILLDLDNDNSSFAFRGDFCADTFCVPPIMVSDTDVVIISAFDSIGSIVLELGGVLDIGQEFLSISSANNISIIGNNTSQLFLENNGNAIIADFEQAIENIMYNNVSPAITFGRRTVMVTAFTGGESSLVSIAELPLSNEQMVTLATLTEPTCYGFDNGSISLSSSGGIPPYTYQWQIPQQGSFVDNLPAGSYPFMTVDSIGCSRLGTAFLDQPDTLIAVISYDGHPSICDTSGHLEATASGGSGLLDYQWDNGATGPVNSGLGPGLYQLSVEDTNGCVANASFTIEQGDTLLAVQNGEVCQGDGFDWNGGTYFVDTMACEIYSMLNGCDSTVCLSLSVLPPPNILLLADGDLCTQPEVTISAGAFESYLWSTGETTPQVTVTTPGQYSVAVTNVFGCTGSASISIAPPISYDLLTDGPDCFGESTGSITVVGASGGIPPLTYSIDGGSNFFTEGIFIGLQAGTYELSIEGAGGCSADTIVKLHEPPEIFLDAGADQMVGIGDSVTLSASTNLPSPTVAWNPSNGLDCPTCLVTVASPGSTTFYEIEVADSNGCAAIDGVNITVDDEPNRFFPTAFSPNGDGINDFFTVYSDNSIKEVVSLKVFDRWGSLVFERRNFLPNEESQGWDGLAGGEPAQAGVYAYKVELLKIDGGIEAEVGDFSLLR